MDESFKKNMNIYTCPSNHTYVYTLKVPYTKTIDLQINNEIIHTHVNTYMQRER